jgi:hypothetical protein
MAFNDPIHTANSSLATVFEWTEGKQGISHTGLRLTVNMETHLTRILVIEDNQDDEALLLRMLKRARLDKWQSASLVLSSQKLHQPSVNLYSIASPETFRSLSGH